MILLCTHWGVALGFIIFPFFNAIESVYLMVFFQFSIVKGTVDIIIELSFLSPKFVFEVSMNVCDVIVVY